VQIKIKIPMRYKHGRVYLCGSVCFRVLSVVVLPGLVLGMLNVGQTQTVVVHGMVPFRLSRSPARTHNWRQEGSSSLR
jgi:hypothetical protein